MKIFNYFKYMMIATIIAISFMNTGYSQNQITGLTATASSYTKIGDYVPCSGGQTPPCVSSGTYPPSNALDGNSSTFWMTWTANSWLKIALPKRSILSRIKVSMIPWKNCKVQLLLNSVVQNEILIDEFNNNSTIDLTPSFQGYVDQIKILVGTGYQPGVVPIGVNEVLIWGYGDMEYISPNGGHVFYTGTDQTNPKFLIDPLGNVIIGNVSPAEDFKLSVAGKIHAAEIQVDALPWPDYVFTPSYNLRTLTEVENFINQNNHLPDVPSETQVKEEGISLGEMNAILLQKIEELTLYMIEHEKRNNEQQKQIDELKKQITNSTK